MTGWVDDYGRALIRIKVRSPLAPQSCDWDAWIDTGFTGQLLLTQAQVVQLGLAQSSDVSGALADGTRVRFATYSCLLAGQGQERPIEAIAGSGRFALIGIRLLEDLTVTIDYPGRRVHLAPSTHLPSP